MADTAEIKADLYRVLAHPMRLRVLELLQTQERSARDLQQLLELGRQIISTRLTAQHAVLEELAAERVVEP